jgi:hypothetical protein
MSTCWPCGRACGGHIAPELRQRLATPSELHPQTLHAWTQAYGARRLAWFASYAGLTATKLPVVATSLNP